MIIRNSKLKHKATNFKISVSGNNILKTDLVQYL